jgi:hypothetical protein
VVLLTGQNAAAENGFWLVGETGGERDVSPGRFAGHIGPSGEDGHSQQFKVAVTAGTNAGKTYYLATPCPALFEHKLYFYELVETTPGVSGAHFDKTPPGQHA